MRIRVLRVAIVSLALLGSASGALSQQEYDPAAVSESLKAIFRYGAGGARKTAERLNTNTVTVMSGTIGGTYVQFGADLASVLDEGDDMRVLPIVGRGSVQSIADILFLKGVDIGIIRSDTLDYLERKGYAANIKKQFTYITKLYNEEMLVVAPKSIRKLSDLAGKTVAVDLPNGGTFVTASIVFERLGIKAKFAYIEQRVAFERLLKGEIDAMIAVQGSPSRFVSQIKDDRLHLVPVDYARPLQTDYLPAQLTSNDYPSLIEKGQRVDTIAVPAILAAYNWPPESDRYRRVERFTHALFSKIEKFQKPPFHPKWKEVSVGAPLPGWTRFRASQEWIDRNVGSAGSADTPEAVRREFEAFLNANRDKPGAATNREVLFKEFLTWRERQGPRRQ